MTTATAPASTVDRLRARTTGEVVVPGEPGYDAATLAWNVRYKHRPAIVVVAETTLDVVEAVRYARAEGLRIAVQATGHGPAGLADGGAVLVDVGKLSSVEVDAEARTARVGGGTKWGPILEAAQAAGLAPLLGSTTDVGAVGYTLGGGLGWLSRKYGLSLDNVRSFELVTPDGALRTASPTTDPELFDAMRGGGAGSLGVVTAMTIDLAPVGTVYAGNLFYPAEMAAEVVARFRAWATDAPDELTSSVVLMNFPPLEEVPEPIRGRSFVIVRGCWCGPVEEGEEIVRYWRDWRAPALDLFGPMPFAMADTISNDPTDPLPVLVHTEWLKDLADDAIAALVEAAFPSPPVGPPPFLFAQVRHVGGAVGRATGGVYGNRSAQLLLEAVAITPTLEALAGATAHAERLSERLGAHLTGGKYLNFLEGDDRLTGVTAALGTDGAARLAAAKRRIDPDGAMAFGVGGVAR